MAKNTIGSLLVELGIDSTVFEKGVTKAQKEVKAMERAISRAARPIANFGRSMQKAGKAMSLAFTAPLVGFGSSVLMAAANFEQSMNRVSAISGAVGEDLKNLSGLAKEMGATTQFSASQAADAMTFLSMAGFKTTEIMDALPATLQLAAAAQIELSRAADIASNVLSGYGFKASELGRVNDVLAKTFTSTNTTLEQLGEAMKMAAPIASAAGVQFTEASAAIGLMGNAGIQATMAGTALRGGISKLLEPTAEAKKAMAGLGLSFTDSEGRLISLDKIIQQLEPHANDAGLFLKLFGERAGPAMAALVSQGSDALRNLTKELDNAGGTAQSIADKQMEGFNGAMKALRSSVEALLIAIGESGVLEAMTSFANKLTELIRNLSQADSQLLKVITTAGLFVAALGPLLIIFGSLTTALAPFITIITKLNSVKGLGGLKLALIGLNGPVLILVAALIGAGGLAYAFRQINKDSREAKRKVEDFNAAIDKSIELRKKLGENGFSNMGKQDQLLENRVKLQNQLTTAQEELIKSKERLAMFQKMASDEMERQGYVSDRTKGKIEELAKRTSGFAKSSAELRKEIIDTNRELSVLANSETNTPVISSTGSNKTNSNDDTTSISTKKEQELALVRARQQEGIRTIIEAEIALANKRQQQQEGIQSIVEGHMAIERSVDEEIAANEELLAALKVSQREYDITLEKLQILARDGFLGTEEQARKMAERLVASREPINQFNSKLSEVGENDPFASLETSLTSLISALKSGDFGSILQSIAGLFGKGGSGGGINGINGVISTFAGFFDKGGNIGSGQWGIAGENGPEFIKGPATVMSTAKTAGVMQGSMRGGMGGIAQIIPSPYFDVVVDGRSANMANQIAPVHANSAVVQASASATKRGKRRLA